MPIPWFTGEVTAGYMDVSCNPASLILLVPGTSSLAPVINRVTLSIALQTHTNPADDAVLRFSLKSVKVFNHRYTDRQ